jgi:hypothetical protein
MPRNFRDVRPEGRLVYTKQGLKRGQLLRPGPGFVKTDYKYMEVSPAPADWVGPLYVATQDCKPRSLTFVAEMEYVQNFPLEADGGSVLYLGEDGAVALSGSRPVGTLLVEEGSDKSPIAHLSPGQCAVPAPTPKRNPRKRKPALDTE